MRQNRLNTGYNRLGRYPFDSTRVSVLSKGREEILQIDKTSLPSHFFASGVPNVIGKKKQKLERKKEKRREEREKEREK